LVRPTQQWVIWPLGQMEQPRHGRLMAQAVLPTSSRCSGLTLIHSARGTIILLNAEKEMFYVAVGEGHLGWSPAVLPRTTARAERGRVSAELAPSALIECSDTKCATREKAFIPRNLIRPHLQSPDPPLGASGHVRGARSCPRVGRPRGAAADQQPRQRPHRHETRYRSSQPSTRRRSTTGKKAHHTGNADPLSL